jgi:RNase P/RNase MRP subunit POP5
MNLKLKPSARINRRYLLLRVKNKEVVEKAILDYVGSLGWGKAAPFFVEQNGDEIVLAIERKSLNDVRASFELSLEKIKILRVSGTLKGLSKG